MIQAIDAIENATLVDLVCLIFVVGVVVSMVISAARGD